MIPLHLLRSHLNIDADLTEDDQLIIQMEAAAVEYVQNETGRYFGPIALLTDVLYGYAGAPLWLRATPIMDDDERPFLLEEFAGDVFTPLTAGEYTVAGARIYPVRRWQTHRMLRATYWGGYLPGDEPADVQQAVREIVTRMYERRLPYIDESTLDLIGGAREVIRAHKVMVV
jgi:hypothetical protein